MDVCRGFWLCMASFLFAFEIAFVHGLEELVGGFLLRNAVTMHGSMRCLCDTLRVSGVNSDVSREALCFDCVDDDFLRVDSAFYGDLSSGLNRWRLKRREKQLLKY